MQGRKMFAWADQNVRGSLWADIFKRKRVVIFIHQFCRDLFRANFAEQTVLTHFVTPNSTPSSRRTTIGVKPSFTGNFADSQAVVDAVRCIILLDENRRIRSTQPATKALGISLIAERTNLNGEISGGYIDVAKHF